MGHRALDRDAFTTSAKYTGNLGGLAGADAKCTLVAAGSALERVKGRSFVAWLSGPTAAADRLVHGTGPYVLPTGARVAIEWGVFASGAHERALDLNESGQSTVGNVWTSTTDDGQSANANFYDCKSWTTSSGATNFGLTGNAATRTDGWSNNVSEACSNTAALYCVEQ